jgi:hypothetical protein
VCRVRADSSQQRTAQRRVAALRCVDATHASRACCHASAAGALLPAGVRQWPCNAAPCGAGTAKHVHCCR